MSLETESLFARVIQDHLELKERNARLGDRMPIDRYTTADPFENHPLFKSEDQARIEDTLGGTEPAVALVGSSLPWPGEGSEEHVEGPALHEGLWGRSRDFDWGD
jgi:hypothetical protein